jgi:hypothetical protein
MDIVCAGITTPPDTATVMKELTLSMATVTADHVLRGKS